MSIYKFVTLVIFFSSWVDTRQVFVNLLTTSAGEKNDKLEEGKKKLVGETFLQKAVNHVGNLAQSLRRLLKMIRKWYNSHPTEVKLGACLASYFNIKIPGLRRSEHFDDFKDQKDKTSIKWKPNTSGGNQKGRNSRNDDPVSRNPTSTVKKSSNENLVSILWNYYEILAVNFWRYQDLITKNHLAVCTWNYSVKKFWTWVDAAPLE